MLSLSYLWLTTQEWKRCKENWNVFRRLWVSWSIYTNGWTIWEDWSAFAGVTSTTPEILEGLSCTVFHVNSFQSSLYKAGFFTVQLVMTQWLGCTRLKKFFTLYNTPDEQIASIHLEGKVLPWFQLLEKAHQVPDWLSLSTVIQIQFGPSQFDNPHSDLFKLKKSSTVANYYASFTELANQSYGLIILYCLIVLLVD